MGLVFCLLAGQFVGDAPVVVQDLLLVTPDGLQVADSHLESLWTLHHQQARRLAGCQVHVETHRPMLQGGSRQPEIRLGLPERILGGGQPLFGMYLGDPGVLQRAGQFFLLCLKVGYSLAGGVHLVGLGPDGRDVQHGQSRRSQQSCNQPAPPRSGDHEPSGNSTGASLRLRPSNRTAPSAASLLRWAATE